MTTIYGSVSAGGGDSSDDNLGDGGISGFLGALGRGVGKVVDAGWHAVKFLGQQMLSTGLTS